MDERAQHGYAPAGNADPRSHQAPVDAPWPSYQQPQQHGAPAYQQPAQAPAQQFQFAPAFVMPGAPGDVQAMSAHGGTIGVPVQQPHVDMMPMLHGGHALHAHAQHYGPIEPNQPQYAAAAAPSASPQSWAYPTPNGMQLVQPGPAQPQGAYALAQARGSRRMKWETIVPAAAVACLIAAVALFISDFDRITGRSSGAKEAPAASSGTIADVDTPKAASAADADAVLGEAAALFKDGRFDDAANLVHPMLKLSSPDARLVTLLARIDAANARNTALLTRLQHERSAGKWTAVLGTIGQLERLRPLSPSLIQLRAKARRTIAARKAAPSTSVHGGGSHQPPPAGGHTHASTNATPPATSPTKPASLPPRPDANPVSNNGGGIGAAPTNPCPTGTMAHTHGGTTECMAM